MEVIEGDVVEIPHPHSSARIRIVVTGADAGKPVSGRTIAYLPSAEGIWLHHLGAVEPIAEIAPGAFIVRSAEVSDSSRSIAIVTESLEEVGHKLLTFARELSGSIGAMR